MVSRWIQQACLLRQRHDCANQLSASWSQINPLHSLGTVHTICMVLEAYIVLKFMILLKLTVTAVEYMWTL